MKKIDFNTKVIATIMIGCVAAVLFSFTTVPDEWDVPAEYLKMTNPVTADDESIDIGEVIYSKHCKSCHGKYGEGDGPKAAELETSCGDFTTEEFQNQNDGSLYYKIWVGRDDMPAFDKKIPDEEDVWHLVNFVRTLGE